MEIFGDADYESTVIFKNLKWRSQYSGPKFWKLFNFYENSHKLGFWVADSKQTVRFSKFKMVVIIWRN